ncbi:MAG: tRNA (adenosine(37)-N6)-dimethylallyltransferase MiaA [Hyphomicrobium sp.]|jgi:tRNA dimethylallyltransferase|nr:tRNA (adenosine(37)-N6)-dimethylallyltransferase MiaA [Hyphomicrobium sp.]
MSVPPPASSRFAPILIAGATASGKSALAMRLARELGGVVINADSMQVYRELNILTARPSPADEAVCPHALYGHVGAHEAYSVGRYVTEAAKAIASARVQGLRPIITGGTGLYFKGLTEGLSPIPEVALDVRAHWRKQAEALGAQRLHELLLVRDPVMAEKLNPADPQRIVRALEVLDSSGKSLSYWQAQPGTPVVAEANAVRLLVRRDREDLHLRAGRRFDDMMAKGALEEVSALAALQLDPVSSVMRALGVAPLLAAVRGQMELAEAMTQAKAETRQYVKRQDTWFRKNMISWKPISTQQMESNNDALLAFIDP